MARTDLNIVERGTQGTEWIAEDVGLTAEHLDDVLEQKTDNSGALNSLPTPFARFFVAREAFRRAMEEHVAPNNPNKQAGFAYNQLVSDILDVYELLFNLKYHKNNTWKNGEKIELREWKRDENLAYIKKKMQVLHNSIQDYYKTDIVEDKLFFLVYTEDGKDRLLACSSPHTGFVTPPDMDKSLVRKDGTETAVFEGEQYKDLHIRRKSGGEYFRDVKLFQDRETDFKNYMYNVLLGSDDVDSRLKAFKEYVRCFKNDPEIRNDYSMRTAPVPTDQNDPLVINGLHILSSDEIDINSYFNPTLIRIPYRVSRDNFTTVTYQNDFDSRAYDFLLPFKPEVLNLFKGGNIDSDVHINRNSITVYLRYNGKTYEKEYAEDPFRAGQGKIIDLQKALISFDLGLFPNILSHKESENNYFKILVVAADEDPAAPNFNIDKISLSFFKKSNSGISPINEVNPSDNAQFGVLPAVVRSRQKTESEEGGTKFYELFNTSFDVIEVELLGDKGIIIPNWIVSEPSNDIYTYAIDLGTSNTFMSRCLQGQNTKPEMFKMNKPMVNFLHETPKDKQYSLTRRIENSIFEKAKNKIKTEFLPALIDGIDYKFPIRTALCGILKKTDKPKLFDNHNIAFFYERLMSNDDQHIHTDIKWEKDEDMLRVFVRELLLIIKCDILQHNGDLDRTRLVWFRPLSFMGQTRAIYQDIWTDEPAKVLFIQPNQIDCFSESEAPYYYFKKKDYIKDSDAVTVIDIGGGSTDFVYFRDNQPLMANSVHFGCDVLWENGFMEFEDEKKNGIYNKYANTLRFDRADLEELNECFKNVNKSKTKDIINFWLSNAEHCSIIKLMREDFKPVFLYHLSSILYYMAYMYKDNNLSAPHTVVFSGNGSKYIDNFISSDRRIIQQIINMVFSFVFGGEHNIHLELPQERKESTCYGGLYRDPNEPNVPEVVYHGDKSCKYENVGDVIKNYDTLKKALLTKYNSFTNLYKVILDMLKREHIIDNTADTATYTKCASEDMGTPLDTYFKTQIKEKYAEEVMLYDSVFFLPVINRIFEMTKLQ